MVHFCDFLGVGICLNFGYERKAAPFRAEAFNQMRSITLSPIPLTFEQSRSLQATNLNIAQKAVDIQRTLRLGPFSRQALKP